MAAGLGKIGAGMKKRFCLVFLLAVMAVFLVSCADDSMLLLDGSASDEQYFYGTDAVQGPEDSDEQGTASLIMVHICGMVNMPGVYEVEEGSRVYEVVELAGGFAPGAAESYLNLAETVADGQKLVVPSLEEADSDRYGQAVSAGDTGLVNINTADKEELMTLPGIGEAKALAIIAWRTEHGSFQSTEEIMQVSGIKESAYEKIKLLITTE